MKRVKKIELIEIATDELEALLARAKAKLSADDFSILRKFVDSMAYLTRLVEDKKTTIRHLRQLFFGSKSEKTSKVFPEDSEKAVEAKPPQAVEEDAGKEKKKRKGHGRNAAAAYRGAEKIQVPHASLKPGDACPECHKGKVYRQSEPGVIVHIVGQTPLRATVFELEKLRCNLCGEIFTAQAPKEAVKRKYDATAASLIALFRRR